MVKKHGRRQCWWNTEDDHAGGTEGDHADGTEKMTMLVEWKATMLEEEIIL